MRAGLPGGFFVPGFSVLWIFASVASCGKKSVLFGTKNAVYCRKNAEGMAYYSSGDRGAPLFEIEAYPDTIVEILRILDFSGGIQASGDLQNALRREASIWNSGRSGTISRIWRRRHCAALWNKGVVLNGAGRRGARMLLSSTDRRVLRGERADRRGQ
jgi:hypothetical protein